MPIYYSHTKFINGVNLTQREIDVISCIINTRGTKKIAAILSISLRTAERHIQNIMLKTRCNSQEAIKDFIEKSENFLSIKQHYFHLLIKNIFEQQLKKIAALVKSDNITCFINYEQKNDNINLLIKYLKLAGINIVNKEENKESLAPHILHILSKEPADNHSFKSATFESSQGPANIFILFDNNTKQNSLKEHSNLYVINCKDNSQYYYIFFKILSLLLPKIDISEFASELQRMSNNNRGSHVNAITTGLELVSKLTDLSAKKSAKNRVYKLQIFSNKFILISLVCLLILIIGFRVLTNSTNQISSNLSLPHNGILLKRTNAINKIESCFDKNLDKIQTIVILGTGGSGKSTLAHMFARKQDNSVIWELNAENEDSLIDSFLQLAYLLCSTSEDRQELKEIQDVEKTQERNEKIFFFVQKGLKKRPNWLLIFDNIENFKHIQRYFPYNVKACGQGRIIITTRDANIKNNSYIANDHLIQIENLSEEEKFQLFTSIIQENNSHPKSAQNQDTIIKFLEYIPSFPLDVISAGYYIKETGIAYDKYVELINSADQNLALTQENILKEVGKYYKTRYGIITLSLKQIVSKNPAFEDLLLIISLINSQNIPTDLLTVYKDFNIVNNFIIELKRLSFITDYTTTDQNKILTFSIHRIAQSIALATLINSSDLQKNKEKLTLVADSLIRYMDQKLVKYYYPEEMKIFIAHAEALLSHNSLLTKTTQANIIYNLGRYYFFLGNYAKAKEMTEQALSIYEKQLGKNSIKVAQTLIKTGRRYSEIGNYKMAKEFLTRGYLIYKNSYGDSNRETLDAKFRLAVVDINTGFYLQAQKDLEEIFELNVRHYGRDHKMTARILVMLGSVYKHLGLFEKAIASLEQGLLIYKKHYGTGHKKLAHILINLADVYKNIGLYKNAKILLQEGYSIYKKHYGNDNIKIAKTLVIWGSLYHELGAYSEAFQNLEDSLLIYKNHYGYQHHKTARVLRDLGAVFLGNGDLIKAESLFNEALAISKKATHPDQFKILELLGDLNIIKAQQSESSDQKESHMAKALLYLLQAMEIARESLPSNSYYIEKINSKILQIQPKKL